MSYRVLYCPTHEHLMCVYYLRHNTGPTIYMWTLYRPQDSPDLSCQSKVQFQRFVFSAQDNYTCIPFATTPLSWLLVPPAVQPHHIFIRFFVPSNPRLLTTHFPLSQTQTMHFTWPQRSTTFFISNPKPSTDFFMKPPTSTPMYKLIEISYPPVTVCSEDVTPDLSVFLAYQLTMAFHARNVVRSCFYHMPGQRRAPTAGVRSSMCLVTTFIAWITATLSFISFHLSPEKKCNFI